jgi:hypothetical protein
MPNVAPSEGDIGEAILLNHIIDSDGVRINKFLPMLLFK